MPAKKKRRESDPSAQEANRARLSPSVLTYSTRTQPRSSSRTGEFKRDWEKLAASGRYDMPRLKTVMMHLIANDGPLPGAYGDHPLSGVWSDYRDCHISGDWLLIYRISDTEVVFARTGTHSELFKK